MSVIASGVNATIGKLYSFYSFMINLYLYRGSLLISMTLFNVFELVCFAEAPAEFEENHPILSEQMRKAYNDAYPGCL